MLGIKIKVLIPNFIQIHSKAFLCEIDAAIDAANLIPTLGPSKSQGLVPDHKSSKSQSFF